MSDLIEALTILLKYGNHRRPTICEHDVLIIPDIDHTEISEEDMTRLTELGFFVSEEYGSLASFRYGSA
jgi:hypothetical protein